MKEIESRNNPIIKKALKALSNPNNENLIVVEGQKLLGEAIKSGAKPEMIFVASEENGFPRSFTTARNDGYNSNWVGNNHNNKNKPNKHKQDELATNKATINYDNITYKISRGLMRELSTVQTPSDIISFLTPALSPQLEDLVKKSSMLVVLDRLQDPGNIGTIMRTSEAMGVSGILLLKGCCNPNNHKVIRAAMGSSFRIPVLANVEVENLFKVLKNNGYMTICADMEGTILKDFKFSEKSAIFMGQEGQGLSSFILENCKYRIAIPMFGQVESLNVATSTAICLYEWARNRVDK